MTFLSWDMNEDILKNHLELLAKVLKKVTAPLNASDKLIICDKYLTKILEIDGVPSNKPEFDSKKQIIIDVLKLGSGCDKTTFNNILLSSFEDILSAYEAKEAATTTTLLPPLPATTTTPPPVPQAPAPALTPALAQAVSQAPTRPPATTSFEEVLTLIQKNDSIKLGKLLPDLKISTDPTQTLKNLFQLYPQYENSKDKIAEQIDSIYNNREFDEKIKEIKTAILEFRKKTSLNKDSSFENQLINIDVFLTSLNEFETTLRSRKKYQSSKPENIEPIINTELGKPQKELEKLPEPNIKSVDALKQLKSDKMFNFWENLLSNKKTIYNDLVFGSSNFFEKGQPTASTLANLPKSIDKNQNPVYTSPKTESFDESQKKVLDRYADILSMKKEGLKNHFRTNPNHEFEFSDSPFIRILSYCSSTRPKSIKAMILMNIVTNSNIKVNKFPFLKKLKDEAVPVNIGKLYTSFKKNDTVIVNYENNKKAYVDYISHKHVYDLFLHDLFSGLEDSLLIPLFDNDGELVLDYI